MADWSVEVYDGSGNLVADLSTRATKRRIVKTRNRADTIELEYDLDNIKKLSSELNLNAWDIFAVAQNEIRIKRNDTVYSAGQIMDGYPIIDGDSRKISITAVGWLDLFGSRYTDEGGSSSDYYFSATDAGQIAWGLIDASQNETNGDFGITQGYIQASVNRDRQSYVTKNIRDALIELTEVINGFDFEFTWDKKFNVYYPKIGTKKNNVILTYPGAISLLSFGRRGVDIANNIIARGAGTGADAFAATATDTASQSKFKLRQDIVEFFDVSEASTLQDHADEELKFRRSFVDVPDITLDPAIAPNITAYGIGDVIKIEVLEDLEIFSPINDWFRIDSIDLTIDENNIEIPRLKLMK